MLAKIKCPHPRKCPTAKTERQLLAKPIIFRLDTPYSYKLYENAAENCMKKAIQKIAKKTNRKKLLGGNNKMPAATNLM